MRSTTNTLKSDARKRGGQPKAPAERLAYHAMRVRPETAAKWRTLSRAAKRHARDEFERLVASLEPG